MAAKVFLDPAFAETYAAYRFTQGTTYVKSAIDFLGEKLPNLSSSPWQQAIDIGCGSGQSTSLFAPFFQKVIGIDYSIDQIQQAKLKDVTKNISFIQGTSENMPVPDSSTQLITASQAAHWFDLPTFFKEANRVLVPNGVISLCAHVLNRFGGPHAIQLNQIHDDFYWNNMQKYFAYPRKEIENGYKGIEAQLPYDSENQRRVEYNMEKKWTLAQFMGYLSSWTGYQNYIQKHPKSTILQEYEAKFKEALDAQDESSDQIQLIVIYPCMVLLARKPDT